ncbi:MAG: glycosyltransferase family 39 protein [Verrucomicrobiae bacterium]|nr:glycosyltransferase family 39 protein [Verrucomicrobiae bacterium]
MKRYFTERQIQRLLWILIAGGCVARLLDVFCNNPLDHLRSDSLRHWSNGLKFLHPDYMGGYDPIGYQVYMFLLQSITGQNRWLIAFMTGLLSVGMPWTYYRAARELGMSKNRSLFLWTLMVWMPSLFFIYQFFMMETLLLFMMGLGFWMTGRCLRKGTPGSLWLATAAWTFACLTKAIPLPLAAACLLYAWWKRSRKISHALAAIVLVGLLLLPNAIRSRHILGFSAPLGNVWLPQVHHRAGTKSIRIENGGASWRYSSPSCYIQPLAPLSPWMMERAYNDDTVCVKTDRASGGRDWKEAYGKIHVTWKEWFTRWLENMVLFLFAPPWPDCYTGTWLGMINYWQRWLWGPLIFFLMDCNFRMFRRRCFDLIPVVATLFTLWLFSQNMATMEGRFRKPLEPVLLLNLAWMMRRGKIEKNHISPNIS